MHDLFVNLFSSGSFIPHGHCYLWKPNLVWLHVVSDAMIALAYYSIPLTLFYFVRKRPDLPFSWIFLLFATFIISCGTTHLAEIWTLWHPTYWLSGFLKAGTAIISFLTAIELIPLVPQALALPSPAQLSEANEALRTQVEERWRAEAELKQLQDELEQRVEARTAELVTVNQQLQQEIEERHRVETALRASRERLVLAQQVGKMGTCEWNIKTGELIWTEEMEVLFGLAPGSFEGSYEHWVKRLHPDDRPDADRAAQRTALEGADFDTECRILLPDGAVRWVTARAQVFYDDCGKPDRLIGVNMDITERKQAEAALRKSEAKFRRLADANIVGVISAHTGGAITDANEAFLKMMGYTQEEVLTGKVRWDEMTPPDLKPLDGPALEELLSRGAHAPYEKEYFHKDGHRIPILVGSALLENDLENVISFILDITERKQAEQAAQERNRRLKLLYETTRELLSAKHPLELMNHLFAQLSEQMELHYYYQFQVSEQAGRQSLRLMTYGGLSEDQAASLETLEWGQSMCGLVAQECRQLVLNQAAIAAHPHAQIIRSMGVSAYAGQPLMVHGRLVGILSFASLTRTYFTPEEADLLQAISEQVAIALDRTELVASLQQQTEDLAQANRVKDEFLAVLSHELRSPLNPILGWTKLLQTGQFDAQKTKQALEIIERNAKQQTQLIEDLLDISRILRGKLVLTEMRVDLVFIIEAVLETVRLAAEAKNIQITTTLDASLPPVLGDGGRLQQIVLNLLSNAIKFTPQGGQVDVRLERVGSEAQIQVKDTGIGISPDFLPYVFESFRQADGRTTRRFGGLGLGLAIVRQLTELHGGTVHAESQGEGTGATFTIRLPLLKPHGLSLRSAPPFGAPSNGVNALQGIRVLVVDDEADMRELMATILEQAGAIAQTAASAAEALAMVDQFQPEVLISDIGMPDMDGYELMRQLKRRSSNFSKPILAIALTAYAMEQDQQQALAVGYQRHLAKPIEPAVLVKAIATLARQE